MTAIVILGDPHNYCKHGFKGSKDFNISDTKGYYPYGVLALDLQEGILAEHTWTYHSSDVYDIDEHDANEYDKNLLKRKKATMRHKKSFQLLIEHI